jgi:hypothetical protein
LDAELRRKPWTQRASTVVGSFAERSNGTFVTMIPRALEQSIMTNRPPPIPPASRSPKGPGNQAEPLTSADEERADQAPENLKEQDREGNIKQNTTNQGYQQAR